MFRGAGPSLSTSLDPRDRSRRQSVVKLFDKVLLTTGDGRRRGVRERTSGLVNGCGWGPGRKKAEVLDRDDLVGEES